MKTIIPHIFREAPRHTRYIGTDILKERTAEKAAMEIHIQKTKSRMRSVGTKARKILKRVKAVEMKKERAHPRQFENPDSKRKCWLRQAKQSATKLLSVCVRGYENGTDADSAPTQRTSKRAHGKWLLGTLGSCSNHSTVQPSDEQHSRVVLLGEDESSRIAILPSRELLNQLQEIVVEHRELEKVERDHEMELERLFEKHCSLHHSIHEIKARLSEWKQSQPDSQTLQEQVTSKKARQVQIAEETEKSKRHMGAYYAGHVEQQRTLLEMLDLLFVKSGMIEPKTQVVEPDTETAPEASNDDEDESPLADDEEDIATNQHQAELVKKFGVAARGLRNAEHSLYTREVYDRAYAERAEQIATGEKVEDQSKFDMKQLQLMQGLTRAVFDAEAVYEIAKAEAVEGGVCLGNYMADLQSGFGDDPDDGYRLSEEAATKASVDVSWISSWYDDVLSATSPSDRPFGDDEGQYLSYEQLLQAEAKCDEWDARTVEVCDSWSMVAAGSERKRIDRWRSECGMLAEHSEAIDYELE